MAGFFFRFSFIFVCLFVIVFVLVSENDTPVSELSATYLISAFYSCILTGSKLGQTAKCGGYFCATICSFIVLKLSVTELASERAILRARHIAINNVKAYVRFRE